MKEKRFSYHWVIVIACFLMMAATVGIVVNCFSILVPPMMADLNYTASQVQLIGLIVTFANLISGVFIGKVMAKMGLRLTLPVYALLMCGGFAARGLCSEFYQFFISSLFCGIGLSGVSTIPGGVLINNWFTEKKGTATGIAFTGSVVGGLVFVQLTKVFIAAYGWRAAHFLLGGISAAILLPTTIFLVAEKPQDEGLAPLGAAEQASAVSAAKPAGITTKAYMKTGSFWLLAFTVFAIGLCNMGMQNNVTICLQGEYGYSAEFAANIFALVMGVQIIGKILLGAVYDKQGVKFGTIYNVVLYILGVAAIALGGNVAMAIAYGGLFGLIGSMTTVTPPYLTALIVGRREYSSIFGILSLFFGLGCAFGPVIAAAVFDKTGSFTPAWIGFAVVFILLSVTSILSVKKGSGFAEMTD